MPLIVYTLPATDVNPPTGRIWGYANMSVYRWGFEKQQIEPTVGKLYSLYSFLGINPFYFDCSKYNVGPLYPDRKYKYRAFANLYSPATVVYGEWRYIYTYPKKFYYQAWGVDKHDIEHYGELKSFNIGQS